MIRHLVSDCWDSNQNRKNAESVSRRGWGCAMELAKITDEDLAPW